VRLIAAPSPVDSPVAGVPQSEVQAVTALRDDRPIPTTARAPSTRPEPPAPAAPPTPSYRLAVELDTPPRPRGDIQPDYPSAAGLQQGSVLLQLLIGDQGAVDEVVVVSADTPGQFEDSTVAAIGASQWAPKGYGGMPVRSRMTVVVEYSPTNPGSAASGRAHRPWAAELQSFRVW
jgi:hypothetical protein